MKGHISAACLKTIDIKADWARREGRGKGPTGDFVTWLRRSKPSCYLLLAIRVVGDGDLQHAVHMAETANQVMDACGLFCYGPEGHGYSVHPVPTSLQMDRVLSRICDQLRSLP